MGKNPMSAETTGFVTVTTPSRVLKSKVKFRVTSVIVGSP